MQGYLVVIIALSLAFTVKDVLHWNVKPYNCTKCLTGWFSFFIALIFHTPYWYFYLFIGLFVGAMFEAIKMRWL